MKTITSSFEGMSNQGAPRWVEPKDCVLTEQALPADLVKRYIPKESLWPDLAEFVDGALGHIVNMARVLGEQVNGGKPTWPYVIHGHYADAGEESRRMAIEDSASPHGIRLLIEDYHYASDTELQAFSKELVEVGHANKKNEPWWPNMQTREELIELCTTLIRQYPYEGYVLNRSTLSRCFIPEKGSPEYYEPLLTTLKRNFFRTITTKNQALTLTEKSIGIEGLCHLRDSEQDIGVETESIVPVEAKLVFSFDTSFLYFTFDLENLNIQEGIFGPFILEWAICGFYL
ncbi:hypothetical protein JHK87_027222 [Glycine soja]|nr:hypothetical protein JHK87_027222 [Glycine soja]